MCALGVCWLQWRVCFFCFKLRKNVQACGTLVNNGLLCMSMLQDFAGRTLLPRVLRQELLVMLLLSLQAIMAVRRELPIWQQLRRLLLTGSLLGDA